MLRKAPIIFKWRNRGNCYIGNAIYLSKFYNSKLTSPYFASKSTQPLVRNDQLQAPRTGQCSLNVLFKPKPHELFNVQQRQKPYFFMCQLLLSSSLPILLLATNRIKNPCSQMQGTCAYFTCQQTHTEDRAAHSLHSPTRASPSRSTPLHASPARLIYSSEKANV